MEQLVVPELPVVLVAPELEVTGEVVVPELVAAGEEVVPLEVLELPGGQMQLPELGSQVNGEQSMLVPPETLQESSVSQRPVAELQKLLAHWVLSVQGVQMGPAVDPLEPERPVVAPVVLPVVPVPLAAVALTAGLAVVAPVLAALPVVAPDPVTAVELLAALFIVPSVPKAVPDAEAEVVGALLPEQAEPTKSSVATTIWVLKVRM